MAQDALVDLEASACLGMAEPKPKQEFRIADSRTPLSCEGAPIGGQAPNRTDQ